MDVELDLSKLEGTSWVRFLPEHCKNLTILAFKENFKSTLLAVIGQPNQSLGWVWNVEVVVASE